MAVISCALMYCFKSELIHWDMRGCENCVCTCTDVCEIACMRIRIHKQVLFFSFAWVNSFRLQKCLPFCEGHLLVYHRSACALSILWELIGVNPGMLTWYIILWMRMYVYINICVHMQICIKMHKCVVYSSQSPPRLRYYFMIYLFIL